MTPDILLPDPRKEFLGYKLQPADKSKVVEKGFNGCKSLYLTEDGKMISFVARLSVGDKEAVETRTAMPLAYFLAANLSERKDRENLSEDEFGTLRELGFGEDDIKEGLADAVFIIERRERRIKSI